MCSLLIIKHAFVIETLTRNNYKRWKEDVEMALTMMDIDIVMREPKSPTLTAGSSASLKAHFKRWDRANRLSLIVGQLFILLIPCRDSRASEGKVKMKSIYM